jgi:hypothetical protein
MYTMKWSKKEEKEGKEEEVEFRYRTLSEVKEGEEQKQPAKAETEGEEWKDKDEKYKFSYETLTEKKEGEKSPAVKSEAS